MKRALWFSLIVFSAVISSWSQAGSNATATYHNAKCGFSFSYPAIYTLKSVPDAPSKADDPRCGLRLLFMQGSKIKHTISLHWEQSSFDEAAALIGVEKSANGWVPSSEFLTQGKAHEISGPGWKGLSFEFAARCYGSDGYEGMGEAVLGFANAGDRTLIIDGGQCERSDFDAYEWIVKSLKFLPRP
jgi:hypothetical protein